MIRNRHLREAAKADTIIVRTIKDAGIAACVIDGLLDKEIANVTGICMSMVAHGVRRMKQRAGVRTRVSLAIVLWESRMDES